MAEKSPIVVENSDTPLPTICSTTVQQTDFKYLYYLKNVYFVLVMSTETEHSMWPLVSLNLFKNTRLMRRCVHVLRVLTLNTGLQVFIQFLFFLHSLL